MSQNNLEVDSMLWLRDLRHRMLGILFVATFVLGAIGIIYRGWQAAIGLGDLWLLPFDVLGYGITLALFLIRRIPDTWRAWGFLGLLYGIASLALYLGWLAGGGRLFLLALIVSATVLVGPRAGFLAAGLSLLTYVAFGVAFNQGWLRLRPSFSPLLVSPMVDEGLGFSLAIGITLIGLWGFGQALRTAARAAHETAQAQALLDERARQLDALNQLLAERSAHLEVINRALEEQMRQANGQVQLSAVLRGEQDLSTLAQRVIQFLCQYLSAPVGAFYVWQGEYLEYAGGYAYVPGENRPRRFRLGEGLVGQVGLDQHLLVVSQLPPDYLSIASGLGGAPSCQVLLWPFLYNGTLMGVAELGALSPFTSEQHRFLEGVAESIAVALHTAQTRARVDALLNQAWQQAEEMKAQEEELRAMNEELQAQAEALRDQQQPQAPA